MTVWITDVPSFDVLLYFRNWYFSEIGVLHSGQFDDINFVPFEYVNFKKLIFIKKHSDKFITEDIKIILQSSI